MRLERATVAALVLGMAACGTSPAAPLVPRVEYQREGQAKASTAASSSRPLVVEWPAAERARLESSAKRGIVVVRYDDASMEVLARCSAEGAYAYTPTTPQREGLRIRDEDELRANLPLGAAALSSQLARAGELSVDLHIVGTYETPIEPPARAALVGDCAGATHVVVALTTGAFQLYAGGSAEVGAGVGSGPIGAEGSSRARRELLSAAGDLEACAASSPEDSTPPFGCGALLRVEVARLSSSAPPAGVDPAAPPPPFEPAAPPGASSSRGPSPSSPPSPSPSPSPSSSSSPPPPPPGDDAFVMGGVLLGLGLTATIVGVVLAVVKDEDPRPAEEAPAGLGRAGVAAPWSSWSF